MATYKTVYMQTHTYTLMTSTFWLYFASQKSQLDSQLKNGQNTTILLPNLWPDTILYTYTNYRLKYSVFHNEHKVQRYKDNPNRFNSGMEIPLDLM